MTVILFASYTSAISQTKEMNYVLKKDVKWFTDTRFGRFIHWTPMSVIDQEIGWSWGSDELPAEKYPAMQRF